MVRRSEELTVLIAGCGSIGRRHARVLRGLGLRDIRACDPVAAQRDTLAAETSARLFASYDEGLASRPDAVFICTPPEMHIPMAIQALESGAHVFCEKPLSAGTEGIDELAASVARSGRVMMVGLCFRFHAGLRKAKALLETGSLGRLVSIRCLVGEHLPTIRPDYRGLYIVESGGAFELTHEIDLAVWFANLPVRDVKCIARTISDVEMRAPDTVEILVDFEGRSIASVHLDLFQIPRRRQTELICTKGVILVEFAQWNRCTVSSCGASGEWRHEELATDRDDMFRAEDLEFLSAVAEGRTPACGIDEARKSVDIAERAGRAVLPRT
jgi:predicted dehydrogenase